MSLWKPMADRYRPLYAADDGGGEGGGGEGGGGEGGAGGGGDWTGGLSDAAREIVNANKFGSADAAILAYGNAVGKLGTPPERLMTLPGDDADDATWGEIYGRLGRPESADGYQYATREGSDDQVDKDVSAFAHKLNLNQKQAALLRDGVYDDRIAVAGQVEARIAEGVANVQKYLVGEYGSEADFHQNAINKAASWLVGGDKALAETMEQAGLTGNVEFVKKLEALGQLITGDNGLMGGAGSSGGEGQSPAWAQAEIERLRGDEKFNAALMDRFHPGHEAAQKKYAALAATAWPEGDSEAA